MIRVQDHLDYVANLRLAWASLSREKKLKKYKKVDIVSSGSHSLTSVLP